MVTISSFFSTPTFRSFNDTPARIFKVLSTLYLTKFLVLDCPSPTWFVLCIGLSPDELELVLKPDSDIPSTEPLDVHISKLTDSSSSLEATLPCFFSPNPIAIGALNCS